MSALLAAAAIAYSPGHILHRWPASSSLHADTHLNLALDMLARSDVLTALITADVYGSSPCLVPLCSQSRVQWSDEELDELQWPPLVAAVHATTAELRTLAEEHAPPDSDANSLLFMLELVHCHARACDGELWLVPETAAFERSSPGGASLELCPLSGDLLLVTEGSSSAADATPSAGPPKGLFGAIAAALPAVTGDSDPPTISSGQRSNDELLLYEGWADESLECERLEIPETLLRAAAAVLNPGEDAAAAAVLHGLRESHQVGRL